MKKFNTIKTGISSLILLAAMAWASPAMAQDEYLAELDSVSKEHVLVIKTPTNSTYAELADMYKKVIPRLDRYYYWSVNGTIFSTQGGASGRLLDGKYIVYFADKSLKEKGTFTMGLKQGDWKEWNEEGHLISFVKWKSGLKEGRFMEFSGDGSLRAKGVFRSDKLISLEGDSSAVKKDMIEQRSDAGAEIRANRPWYKKLLPFEFN